MPIYNAGLTHIDISEVRRYAGLAKCTDFSNDLLRQACNEALVLAVPQGSWNVYAYDSDAAVIRAPQPLRLTGHSIKAHLAHAENIAVLAATIGRGIEQAITNEFMKGNYTAGLLLDAAATAAVETLADQIDHFIAQQALLTGCVTLARFSPGYGDWDITAQPMILALADGAAISIEVNAADMLIPRKSITAVIGLISNGKTDIEQFLCCNTPCTTCNQQDCLSRKDW